MEKVQIVILDLSFRASQVYNIQQTNKMQLWQYCTY